MRIRLITGVDKIYQKTHDKINYKLTLSDKVL